jgi:hypothetical protein
MKAMYYTVDLKELLDLQKSETQKNNLISIEKEKQRLINREKLLKIILPLVHGSVVLHNNKCKLTNYVTTGRSGLLGISKRSIEKEISLYTDYDMFFSESDTVVNINLGVGKVKVWLNKISKHIHTPNLSYSMTTIEEGKCYGMSVENELKVLAKYCSRYTDEW